MTALATVAPPGHTRALEAAQRAIREDHQWTVRAPLFPSLFLFLTQVPHLRQLTGPVRILIRARTKLSRVPQVKEAATAALAKLVQTQDREEV